MATPTSPLKPAEYALLAVAFSAVCLWSWIGPLDRLTWWLEAAPAILIFTAGALLRHRIPLTRFSVYPVWALLLMMLVGAHYTYSEVPPFNWLRDEFGLARNHYDRVSHFLQGVTVAMVGRELALRLTPLRPGPSLFIAVTAATLGVSAACELAEWAAAEIYGGGATAFLGMQGDAWDAQKDMALALMGALSAQLFLRRPHNRALGVTE